MSRKLGTRMVVALIALGVGSLAVWCFCHWRTATVPSTPASTDTLDDRFATDVHPFLERYCYSCHGPKHQEADLNLSHARTVSAIVDDLPHWDLVLQRLEAGEMPPEEAPHQPAPAERAAVVAWLADLRDREARRNAGDPGIVLARRLSNAEFDYTIRDLTGVDIRPTKEFPVDPANEAGFDNSGESLAMSPALLKKYLAAARLVADHVVLKPEGFVFAPHPVVTDTDRDKYCVKRIMDFYERHNVDLADYFLAAWALRSGGAKIENYVDPEITRHLLKGPKGKYVASLWWILNDDMLTLGALGEVQTEWRKLRDADLKLDEARRECRRLRDLVVRLRAEFKPKVDKLQVKGMSQGSQPFVLWRNDQLAGQHLRYTGDAAGAEAEAAARFCKLFPDAFVVTERAPYYDAGSSPKGRLLSAGFHLMHGYYRDDGPLYDLILDDAERREIDALWGELNFITLSPLRQYKDFIFFERAEPPRFMFEAEFDFARSEDKDAVSEAKMARLAKLHLDKARKLKASDEALKAIETYYTKMSAEIRRVELARLAAEPNHLVALIQFAERAYRRPLTSAERDDLLAFYHKLRKEDDLGHEEALRDTLATVLLSPHFCYRFDLAAVASLERERPEEIRPLTDYELASRLSYFLWSSMPDAELLKHAAAGDLHEPEVLMWQTRRMLQDPKVRGLATEFGGNFFDFRRFEEHNSVDRDRFPTFTNELRTAMFEEPIRYFMDMTERNRSILDLLYGNDTFVNRPLAKHYGMREPPQGSDAWVHVEDAERYGRGGLLPMAVFQTKNAPGLRTSPVKRGYWVVRRLLGERIPPPPPTVPELPKDEANLGELTLPQVLARHRENKSCAACHRRFDAIGLVFEDFGPIGERRTKDLGGHPVITAATFPDGQERTGLAGLREYLRDKRQDDFVDNLCRKLFSYALGRGLILTDKPALDDMRSNLPAHGYRFDVLVEWIVLSRQFLNKRGGDEAEGQ